MCGRFLNTHPSREIARAFRAMMDQLALESFATWNIAPGGQARSPAIVTPPATASGVVFITIEDETGIANVILRPKVFERFRPIARLSAILLASGRLERKGEVIHVQID